MSGGLREVHEATLYRPIEPYESFTPVELAEIEHELESAISGAPLDDLLPPSGEVDDRRNVLHIEKLDETVVRELKRRRLVREERNAPGRLIGSPTLVHIVISIIAARIAAEANDRYGYTAALGLRPHTDNAVAHRAGVGVLPSVRRVRAWQVDIGNLLPVPAGEVMIADLLQYRFDNEPARRDLMQAIDELLMGLSSEPQHPADVYRAVERRLADASAAFHGAARSKWKHWVSRTVSVGIAIGTTTGGEALGLPVLVEAALAVTGAALVNIATGPMRSDLGGNRDLQRYRYLHQTRTQLGAVPAG
jgi:hypothetical protein